MNSRELKTATRTIVKNMWPKLVTTAEKYAERWGTAPTVNHQAESSSIMKTPPQSQPAPRATSAPSRCFTSVSLPLGPHGKGADGSAQLTGLFPNRCGLVRWSRQRESLEFHRDSEVAAPRITLSLGIWLYPTH